MYSLKGCSVELVSGLQSSFRIIYTVPFDPFATDFDQSMLFHNSSASFIILSFLFLKYSFENNAPATKRAVSIVETSQFHSLFPVSIFKKWRKKPQLALAGFIPVVLLLIDNRVVRTLRSAFSGDIHLIPSAMHSAIIAIPIPAIEAG